MGEQANRGLKGCVANKGNSNKLNITNKLKCPRISTSIKLLTINNKLDTNENWIQLLGVKTHQTKISNFES